MSAGTVLLAVDFSAGSRKAFEAGLHLARDLHAKVALVHAVSAKSMPATTAVETMGFVDPRTTGLGAASEAAEATLWADDARRAGIEVEVVVRSGHAADVICEEARRVQAAAIVVGSEGKRGLRKLFLGSVAQEVIQKSVVPVLVLPTRLAVDKTAGKAGPILIAIDFSQDSEMAYEAGLRLAHNLKAGIRLVHAVEIPLALPAFAESGAAYSPAIIAHDEELAAEALAQLASRAPRIMHAQPIVMVGHPASCITASASAVGASLVVVGTHGRGGLRKAYLGSVAQSVVQIANRPVLVVPNGPRQP